MSVTNFIPVLWEEKILKELDKQHMLVKNCTTKYSGKITGLGSKVKINSINTPTISDYVPNVTVLTPESLKDESRMLEITVAKSFSFELDEVDGKQATNGVLEEGLRKASIGLKDAAEAFIATKFVEAEKTVTQTALTSVNFFSTMMKAKTMLMANNVTSEEVVLEVSPYVFNKGVLADIVYNQQDNGNMIREGTYSQRLGMKVYVSNNIPVTVTSDEIVESTCIMRTKEAIGYAEQIMKIEKYMPESSFSEAVKGLHVYGAKMIKPKEAVALVLKTAAETTI